ncbi:MAG TPA: hypothetical protein VFJ65_12440 [Solirubrobacterales bacterium]|nr:hypothetical protein [Solirubrobacterales bacterium]
MAERTWSVYLSGEIHSDWRERIEAAEQILDVLRYVIRGELP